MLTQEDILTKLKNEDEDEEFEDDWGDSEGAEGEEPWQDDTEEEI